MQERIETIEKEIATLKERNARVEAEKAWETSWTRILTIAVVTYIVAAIVLDVIGVASPAFAASLPAAGYVLSTLSLPALKRWWMNRHVR